MSSDKYNIKFNNTTFKINLKLDDKNNSIKNTNSETDNTMLNSFFKLLMNNPKAFLNNPEFKKEFNNFITEIEEASRKIEETKIKNQPDNIQFVQTNETKLSNLEDNDSFYNILANDYKCILHNIDDNTDLHSINDVKKLIDDNKHILNDIYMTELHRLYPNIVKYKSIYENKDNKFFKAYEYFKLLSFCVNYGFGSNEINHTEFIGTLYKGINQPIYGFCKNIIHTIICTLMCYVYSFNNIRSIDVLNIKDRFNIDINNLDDEFLFNKEDLYFNYIIYILKSNCSLYCKHILSSDEDV